MRYAKGVLRRVSPLITLVLTFAMLGAWAVPTPASGATTYQSGKDSPDGYAIYWMHPASCYYNPDAMYIYVHYSSSGWHYGGSTGYICNGVTVNGDYPSNPYWQACDAVPEECVCMFNCVVQEPPYPA